MKTSCSKHLVLRLHALFWPQLDLSAPECLPLFTRYFVKLQNPIKAHEFNSPCICPIRSQVYHCFFWYFFLSALDDSHRPLLVLYAGWEMLQTQDLSYLTKGMSEISWIFLTVFKRIMCSCKVNMGLNVLNWVKFDHIWPTFFSLSIFSCVNVCNASIYWQRIWSMMFV